MASFAGARHVKVCCYCTPSTLDERLMMGIISRSVMGYTNLGELGLKNLNHHIASALGREPH